MDNSLNTSKNTNETSFINPSNFSLHLVSVGIIVAIITTFLDINKNTLKGTIVSYSIIISGFIILLSVVINNTKGNNFTLLQILKIVLPFILIIGTTSFLIYYIGKYFNNISKGRVSNNYKTFSTIFTLLTLAEIIVFYRSKNSAQFKRTSTIPNILYWIIIFLGVVNSIVVGIISVDLAYFNTDG